MSQGDAYVEYNQRFFRRWIGVYDLFAAALAPGYRAAAKAVDPTRNPHILDICTGTGQIADRLAKAPGCHVTGIDLSPDMLAKARRRTAGRSVTLLEMDARHLSFDDDSFDAVTLSMALHDMPRQVRLEVLAEATRVAKNRLVVLDYRLPKSPLLRRPALEAIDLFETAYFRRFALEGADSLFAEAGLEPSIRSCPWPLFGLWVFDL